MSKFKIGDKLRCISDSGWCGSEKGVIWTFSSYFDRDLKFINFKETEHIAYANDYASNWELVTSMPELTTGMRVELRCGMMFVVIADLKQFHTGGEYIRMATYDLVTGKYTENYFDSSKWDIIKVYQGHTTSNFLDIENLGKMIWEETNPIKEAKIKRRNEIDAQIALLKLELDGLSD